jgi:hypothetical protein
LRETFAVLCLIFLRCFVFFFISHPRMFPFSPLLLLYSVHFPPSLPISYPSTHFHLPNSLFPLFFTFPFLHSQTASESPIGPLGGDFDGDSDDTDGDYGYPSSSRGGDRDRGSLSGTSRGAFRNVHLSSLHPSLFLLFSYLDF